MVGTIPKKSAGEKGGHAGAIATINSKEGRREFLNHCKMNSREEVILEPMQ
jgi:hypothetical protein